MSSCWVIQEKKHPPFVVGDKTTAPNGIDLSAVVRFATAAGGSDVTPRPDVTGVYFGKSRSLVHSPLLIITLQTFFFNSIQFIEISPIYWTLVDRRLGK